MDAAALTPAEFAAAMAAVAAFEERPLLAVATSGGPDSLALALFAEGWARRRGGRVVALIVDHGLRPESAAEARQVGAWLAARGIRHEVLRWEGVKPASGVQEAAREARYALLDEWCGTNGCLHLLVAHHREDQAETYLIRLGAGSGCDGLAAMPAVRELRRCRLLRPLLGVPKARLVASLRDEGQEFLCDPSNRNPRFERARWRLSSMDEAGGVEKLTEEVGRRGLARVARECLVDALAARAVALHPAGFAAVDAAQVLAAPAELAERLLARVARTIGGSRYPLRQAQVARLRAALLARPQSGRTLGGCRFVAWRGWLFVVRELAAASPPLVLRPGSRELWDGRFDVVARPGTPPMTLGYVGQAWLAEPSRRAPEGDKALPPDPPSRGHDDPGLAEPAFAGLPRLLHRYLPAVWNADGLFAVPHLGRHGEEDGLPLVVFRPAMPLSNAGFTVVSPRAHPISSRDDLGPRSIGADGPVRWERPTA